MKNDEVWNSELEIDSKIKMEICDMLLFVFELRIDFLITNFLHFFEENLKKNSSKNGFLLDEDIFTLIPPLLSTGVTSIDLKYKTDNFFNILNVVEGVIQNKAKLKKFVNYTDEYEVPDLNSLLAKKMDSSLKSEVKDHVTYIYIKK